MDREHQPPTERAEPTRPERPSGEPGGEGIRWTCDCTNPPTLLAIYDASGRIEIKVRDRYYVAHDRILAVCPRCRARHTLEIRQPPAP